MCVVRRTIPFSIDVKGGETYICEKEDHTTRGSEGHMNIVIGEMLDNNISHQ
jgi:hypothetical protein